MSAQCRSCRVTDVLWAETAVNRKKVLLEQAECRPTEPGALLVVGGRWAYSLKQIAERLAEREKVSLDRGRELAITRYPAHLAHFARCPNADQHRQTA